MDFFRASTANLLKAEADAGVQHHVALSVVGTEAASRGAVTSVPSRPRKN